MAAPYLPLKFWQLQHGMFRLNYIHLSKWDYLLVFSLNDISAQCKAMTLGGINHIPYKKIVFTNP